MSARVRANANLHTAEAYTVRPSTKACSSDALLGTLFECISAKMILSPNADDVAFKNHGRSPKGCSRVDDTWYFNTYSTGSLDGVSESICKAVVGDWVRGEPSGCATKCGVGTGMSGTPGAINCTTSSCDADTKPEAKECPKTVDCGELY